MTATGQLVSVNEDTGAATVRLRGHGNETALLANVGVLAANAESFIGFDVLCFAPTGNVNEALYILGAVQRGAVLFDTLALDVTSTSYARDRLVGSDTPAWTLDLAPTMPGLTGAMRISALVMAVDGVEDARPEVTITGGGESTLFVSGDIPDVAEVLTLPGESVPVLTLTPVDGQVFHLDTAASVTLTATAARQGVSLDDAVWRSHLSTDQPPTMQRLTASASPLPLLRIHGQIAA